MNVILFWSALAGIGYGSPDIPRFVQVPIPVKFVSELLDPESIVKIGDIETAFIHWAYEGHNENYKHEIEAKKWIEIVYDPEVFGFGGFIRLIRPWGNGWRSLGGPRFSFSEEIQI